MRDKNSKKPNRKLHRAGFTMVELIVVVVIIMILAGGLTFGISKWVHWTQFKRQNEYAQTLFVAAQNQLTEYSESGQLAPLQAVFSSENEENRVSILSNLDEFKDTDGNPYSLEKIWPESAVATSGDTDTNSAKVENYRDDIYSIIGTADDYKKYLNDSADEQHTALYDLFSTYLYDTSILNATICVEFTPDGGQVFAVLYSDIDSDFSYAAENSKRGETVDIKDRTTSVRSDLMIGYYGVDTLYKATSNSVQKPSISNVKLHNEETLNLTFELSKIRAAAGQLTYEIKICDKLTKHTLFMLTLDGTKLGASNVNRRTDCAVIRYSYDESGKQEPTQNMGTYPIEAWLDEDGKTIHVTLDAYDEAATSSLYYDAYSALMNKNTDFTDDALLYESVKNLKNTFSFRRFGVDATDIYCTIKGRGALYKTTAEKTSNTESAYFATSSIAVVPEGSGTSAEYTIKNARHLSNMRYMQDYTDDQLTGDHASLKTKDKVTYLLTDNVDWKTFQENDGVYNLGESVENYTDFISIKQLRNNAILRTSGGGVYELRNLTLSLEKNNDNGIYGSSADLQKTLGLFLENYGTIEQVAMNSITVTGQNKVGSFCGENEGVLKNLNVRSTSSESPSSVTGTENVGGVFGAQSDSITGDNNRVEYKQLVNNAEVSGTQYIGGIVGKLTAVSDKTIVVDGCANYGVVKAKAALDGEEAAQAQYIGGITGYSEGASVTIENCSSSPYYAGSINDLIRTEDNLDNLLQGKYVGGIVGYNVQATIQACNTEKSGNRVGYIFGDEYVGGIVGYNAQTADGEVGNVSGTSDTHLQNSINEANVIGNEYVGGIVGRNAIETEDSTQADETDDEEENATTSTNLTVENWINKGLVVAANQYAGGITGFNTGNITNCESEVENGTLANTIRQSLESAEADKGSYIGGIAGYNNGVIESGNTTTISVVGNVFGKDYIGGIVGYNDIDADIRNYAVAGGYVQGSGSYIGGYAGVNTSENLVKNGRLLRSDPNEITGEYCVGGTIGANIVSSDENITAVFSADNFLGSLDATAFAGGFIGYNQVVSTDDRTQIKSAIEESVSKIDALKNESDSNITLQQAITVIEQIASGTSGDNGVEGIGSATNIGLTITSNDVNNSTQARLGGITADIYVAGVVGYNEPDTILTIANVINKTEITATEAIEATEQPDGDEEKYNDTTFSYSYAGGIIGKVTNKVTIDSCMNQDVGDVKTQGTYLGGICEINEGTVKNCSVSSIGSNDQDYVGGIAGLNKTGATIQNCTFANRTVTGRNYVGGIVSENYGTVANNVISGEARIAAVEHVGGMVGYGYAGSSIALGSAESEGKTVGNDSLAVNLNATGANVGGVVGTNSGTIVTSQNNNKVTLNGNVTGRQNVGGLVGQNLMGDISNFINNAVIIASNGNAGGIVGISNGANQTISNCDNTNTVSATQGGNAGGIIGENSGTVENCTDSASVVASNGKSGGISAVNSGSINACTVNNENTKITLSGMGHLGGVSGENSGTVVNCHVANINLTNLNNSANSYLGGIVGWNNAGTISWDEADNTVVVGQVDNPVTIISSAANRENINLGGIAGYNTGSITGVANGYSKVYVDLGFSTTSLTYFGNIGGVAGTNNGGTIENCEFNGTVEGTANNPQLSPTYDPNSDFETGGAVIYGYGGIAGVNGDSGASGSGTITNCRVNQAKITGTGDPNNISNVGGIAGVNGVGAQISNIQIGTGEAIYSIQKKSSDSLTMTKSAGEAAVYVGSYGDTNAYGHVGGVVGLNSGDVENSYSTSTVNPIEGKTTYSYDKAVDATSVIVESNRGHVGGIIGYNRRVGMVSNIANGIHWFVNAYANAQDNGCGGIIGYQASDYGMFNCINRATVEKLTSSSNAVGGMVGRLETATSSSWSIAQCVNYGTIIGYRRVGGMIGVWKYYGATISNCINYGKIKSSGLEGAGGIVGNFYGLSTTPAVIVGCENHATIYAPELAGGIVGITNSSTGMTLQLFDCVNTGLISGDTSAKIAGCGGIIGKLNSGVNTTNSLVSGCRNYGYGLVNSTGNLDTGLGGIIAKENGNTIKIQNCFGIAQTQYPISLNLGGDVAANNYYLVNSTGTNLTTYYDSTDQAHGTDVNYAPNGFYVKSVKASGITDAGLRDKNNGNNNAPYLRFIVYNDLNLNDGRRAYYSVSTTGTVSLDYIFTFSTEIDLKKVTTYWNRNNEERTTDYIISYSPYTDGTGWIPFGESKNASEKKWQKDQTTPEVVENNVGSFKARMVRIRVTKSLKPGSNGTVANANACLIRAFFGGTVKGVECDTSKGYAIFNQDETGFGYKDCSDDTASTSFSCKGSLGSVNYTAENINYETVTYTPATDQGNMGKGTGANVVENQANNYKLVVGPEKIGVGYPGFKLNPIDCFLNKNELSDDSLIEQGAEGNNIRYSVFLEDDPYFTTDALEEINSLEKPVISKISDVGNSSIQLQWGEVNHASYYEYVVDYFSTEGQKINTVKGETYGTNATVPANMVGGDGASLSYVIAKVRAGTTSIINDEIQEIWSAYSEEARYDVPAVLPEPKYHIELIEQGNSFSYQAYLDNRQEYVTFLQKQGVSDDELEEELGKISIKISVGTTERYNFNAKDAKSTNTWGGNGGNAIFSAYASNESYSTSVRTMRETMSPQPSAYLSNTSMAEITLKPNGSTVGFTGVTNDTLGYQLTLKFLKTYVLYMRSELMATKDGLPVSLSSSLMRLSDTTTAAVATVLNGLPTDVLESYEDVWVRSYPAMMSNNVVYQGHTVDLSKWTEKSGLLGVSKEELMDLHVTEDNQVTDDTSLTEDGTYKYPSLITGDEEKYNVANGFVVELAADGSYTLYYNALLGYNAANNYQYNEDATNSKMKNQVFYYHLSNTIEERKIQPVPIIHVNDNDKTGNDGDPNKDSMLITWDLNKSGYYDDDGKSNYSVGAVYDYIITGTTSGGTEVQIETGEYTTTKNIDNCITLDTTSWQYTNIKIEITRRGTASNGMTQIFPSTGEKSVKLKTRLSQITRPDVALYKNADGTTEKNSLIYSAVWNNIPAKERAEGILSAYEVNVKPADGDDAKTVTYKADDKTSAEEAKKKFHTDLENAKSLYSSKSDVTKEGSDEDKRYTYTWTEETSNTDMPYKVTKVMELSWTEDKNASDSSKSVWTITKKLTENWIFNATASDRTNDRISKILDLNDYARGEELEISVRALAKTDNDDYRDGMAGVVRELTLPSRLEVPIVTELGNDPGYNKDSFVTLSAYAEGITLTFVDEHNTRMQGKYQLAAAVFNTPAEGTSDAAKVTKPGDMPTASDTTTQTDEDKNGYWNSGATKTLLTKTASTAMNGNLTSSSYTLKLEEENIADYAGKWLKIAMRSVSDSNVSSYWSDEDEANESVNYKWIQIPRVQIATPEIATSNRTLFYVGSNWNGNINDTSPDASKLEVGQRTLNFNFINYSDYYEIRLVRNAEEGAVTSETGLYTRADTDWIYLRKVKDESNERTGYDVFYASTNPEFDSSQYPTNVGDPVWNTDPRDDAIDSTKVGNDINHAVYIGNIPSVGAGFTLPYGGQYQLASETINLVSLILWQQDSEGADEFSLILPDAEEIKVGSGDTLAASFTSQASVKALVAKDNQAAYADSMVSNWYVDGDNKVHNFSLNDYQEAPSLGLSLSTSDLAGVAYEINAKARDSLVFEIEVTKDAVTNYYYTSSYTYGSTDVDNIALLYDRDFADKQGARVRIRAAAIEKAVDTTTIQSGGLSNWTNWMEIAPLPELSVSDLKVAFAQTEIDGTLEETGVSVLNPSSEKLNATTFTWEKDEKVSDYNIMIGDREYSVDSDMELTSTTDVVITEGETQTNKSYILKGKVSLSIDKTESGTTYTLTVPARTSVKIGEPTVEFIFANAVNIIALPESEQYQVATYSAPES